MPDTPIPKSALRARWLAELAQTLAEADRLTGELANEKPNARDAAGLRVRLRDLIVDVDAIRRGVGSATEIAPIRSNRSGRPYHRKPPDNAER